MDNPFGNRVELDILHNQLMFAAIQVEVYNIGIGRIDKIFKTVLMGMEMYVLIPP